MRSLLISLGVTLCLAFNANAQENATFCFYEAGLEQNVSPQLLWAISKVESGHNPYAYNLNKNGTYDYCHMQINSIWHKTLGPEAWKSLSDPCKCTKVAAWILRQCINQYGYTWEAVGCYHSRTPDKRDRYARKVALAIQRAAQSASPGSQILAGEHKNDNSTRRN